jgi:hypothetical protein
MIIDKENLYSEDQAITASAASTNIIDHRVTDPQLGKGGPICIAITITEAFDALTSLTIGFQTDSADSFGSAASLNDTGAIALASLTLGAKFSLYVPVEMAERYSRLYYTVAGSNPTVGKVHAAIVYDQQTNS